MIRAIIVGGLVATGLALGAVAATAEPAYGPEWSPDQYGPEWDPNNAQPGVADLLDGLLGGLF